MLKNEKSGSEICSRFLDTTGRWRYCQTNRNAICSLLQQEQFSLVYSLYVLGSQNISVTEWTWCGVLWNNWKIGKFCCSPYENEPFFFGFIYSTIVTCRKGVWYVSYINRKGWFKSSVICAGVARHRLYIICDNLHNKTEPLYYSNGGRQKHTFLSSQNTQGNSVNIVNVSPICNVNQYKS